MAHLTLPGRAIGTPAYMSPEQLEGEQLDGNRPLRGQIKKHWNPFRMDIRETETVRVASGKHRIRVRVRSTSDKYEESAAILGSFAKDRPTIQQINFERHGKAMCLALR